MEPIHIISLGAGVQSSDLLKRSERGAFGLKPVCAINADTKNEPSNVYAWIEELKAAQHDVPIIQVTQGDLMKDALIIKRSKKTGRLYMKGLIPAYVKNPDGTKGLLGRYCTQDYKIIPIVRECKKIVGNAMLRLWNKNHKRALNALAEAKEAKEPKPLWAWDECQNDPLVQMQIGISADESDRQKPSRVPWILNEHPLVKHGITREECGLSIEKIMGKKAPRSACVNCPFHSDFEWLDLKNNRPNEFEQAVKFEQDLQIATSNQEALRGIPFLHKSLVPLNEVKFEESPSHTQLSLFSNECEGMCGV